MNKAIRTAALSAATLAALCSSGAASAAWTFSDDTGSASISGAFPSFTITGGDDLSFRADLAQYTQVFTSVQTISFSWTYASEDCCGSVWDPAGYVLNGVLNQLSVDNRTGLGSSGTASVAVAAGDVFGWYVFTPDSEQGPGVLSVAVDSVGVVPEPTGLALLLAGIGAFGLIGFRRRQR